MNLQDLVTKYKGKGLNIAILVVALFIAGNIYKNQANRQSVLIQAKDSEAKKNEVLIRIGQLDKQIASLKKVFNSKDVSSVLNKLGNIAKESGVNIVSVKPQAEVALDDYSKYSFNLDIAASGYHDIGKFISKIENSPDIYTVDNINISRLASRGAQDYSPQFEQYPIGAQPADKSVAGQVRATLTISTILLKD